MEFYLDTADVAVVKRLAAVLPIKGVTTNPSIVARSKRPLSSVLQELEAILPADSTLFAQVIAHEASAMVDEALQLREIVPSLVVKVPVTHQGLTAIKLLTQQNIPTLGTAVYGAGQGFTRRWPGPATLLPMLTVLMRRAATALRWSGSCKPCWASTAHRAKCWPPASVRRARCWTVCSPGVRRSPSIRMWRNCSCLIRRWTAHCSVLTTTGHRPTVA